MLSLFKGFSTIGRSKKFKLEGFELVKRDFLNAINIRPGEIPGRPDYGSNLLGLVFEQKDSITVELIEKEIIKIANQDPRLQIDALRVFSVDNTIVVELEMRTVENVSPERIAIEFDEKRRIARYI